MHAVPAEHLRPEQGLYCSGEILCLTVHIYPQHTWLSEGRWCKKDGQGPWMKGFVNRSRGDRAGANRSAGVRDEPFGPVFPSLVI